MSPAAAIPTEDLLAEAVGTLAMAERTMAASSKARPKRSSGRREGIEGMDSLRLGFRASRESVYSTIGTVAGADGLYLIQKA
jgi:hypothetical protein